MPLSRYTIRSEFSLANPDLYRAADKDDPEGLLEGVATAGLVGIIRQLGDLAEFAAEVFHTLHEDILATASRGHELHVRLGQLERAIPLIESLILTKAGHGNFICNQGMEWHPSIHCEQNHFTQGDLPGFIRNAYEDCKSPPRLFTLDRFDVTGVGASLKRYTDPSFFKMEWARSELLKPKKKQRDQKARRLKLRDRQQENEEVGEAITTSYAKFSVPAEVEKTETSSQACQSSDSSDKCEQESLDPLKEENEEMLTASSSLFSGQDGQHYKGINEEHVTPLRLPVKPLNLKMEVPNMELKKDASQLNAGLEDAEKEAGFIADDSASDAENFMDAEAMDFEADIDTETKAVVELDVHSCESMPGNEPCLRMPEIAILGSEVINGSSRETIREQVFLEESIEDSIEENGRDVMSKEKECSDRVVMPDDMERADTGSIVDNAAMPLLVKEDLIMNGHCAILIDTNESLIQESPIATSLPDVEKDAVKEPMDLSTDSDLQDCVEKNNSLISDDGHVFFSQMNVVAASVNECSVVPPFILEEAPSSGIDESCDVSTVSQELPTVVNESSAVSSVAQDGLKGVNESSPILSAVSQELHTEVNESGGLSPFLQEEALPSLERLSQSEEAEDLGVLDYLEANKNIENNGNPPSAHFSQLQEPDVSEDCKQSPKTAGVMSTRKRWQINKLFDSTILAPDLAVDSSIASEIEQGESPQRPSSHSSPSASIQPMRWALGLPTFTHSDDELDQLQGSLGSLSSTSSALSSPRPLMLATTLESISLGGRQQLCSPPQKSADSSPTFTINTSPSGVTETVHEEDAVMKMPTESVVPSAENSAQSSTVLPSLAVQPLFDSLSSLGLNMMPSAPDLVTKNFLNQFVDLNSQEISPPPPPLPPLAWRITRKSQGAPVGASESLEITSQSLSLHSAEAYSSDPPQTEMSPSSISFVSFNTGEKQMMKDSAKDDMHETSLLGTKALNDTQESTAPNAADITDTLKEESVPVLAPVNCKKETSSDMVSDTSSHEKRPLNSSSDLVSDTSSHEKRPMNSSHLFSTQVLPTETPPAWVNETGVEPKLKAAVSDEVWPSTSRDIQEKSESGDFSTEATMSNDQNRFKRRSKWALTSSSDDREVLLEQIRNKSFNLRISGTEKLARSRPAININVAAILERANAIRQAFAGSDDDDEDDVWSSA